MAFTTGYALLIGVGSHQYAPYVDVPITVSDAQAVMEILVDNGYCGYPREQVKFLDNAKASKQEIIDALTDLAAQITADDTLFFFYCGHGALGTDGNYYLVSHDAKIDKGRVVSGTGVSEGELLGLFRAIKAKRVFMVFNACFSGNISPTLSIDDQELQAIVLSADTSNALLGTGEGRIIITACREEQKSYIGSGSLTIFTQALVDGLKGKGVRNDGGWISAYSLYEHVFGTVSEVVKDKFGLDQQPELTVIKGVGPFAVALFKGATALGDFDTSQPVPDLPAVRQVQREKAQKTLGYFATVSGSGTVIQGNANQAVGAGGVMVGGNVGGDVVTGNVSKINTGGGPYVGGNVLVGGDFVGRDKITTGLSGEAIAGLFAPLLQAVRSAPVEVQAQASQKVRELEENIKKGDQGDDGFRAKLIEGLVTLVPGAVSAIVSMFASPILGGMVGPVTKYALDKIQGK